jgi:hypothetical protein
LRWVLLHDFTLLYGFYGFITTRSSSFLEEVIEETLQDSFSHSWVDKNSKRGNITDLADQRANPGKSFEVHKRQTIPRRWTNKKQPQTSPRWCFPLFLIILLLITIICRLKASRVNW